MNPPRNRVEALCDQHIGYMWLLREKCRLDQVLPEHRDKPWAKSHAHICVMLAKLRATL